MISYVCYMYINAKINDKDIGAGIKNVLVFFISALSTWTMCICNMCKALVQNFSCRWQIEKGSVRVTGVC